MARTTLHTRAWNLARNQHRLVARRQLRGLGFTKDAIDHLRDIGWLRAVYRGVYVVGPGDLTQHGKWMAAVLACGDEAALSHESAAGLWRIRRPNEGDPDVSVPFASNPSHDRIVVHRRRGLSRKDITRRHGIPTTTPIATLIDLATRFDERHLEAAINEADNMGLVTPERLRKAVEGVSRPGAPALRRLLDRQTFRLTRSELERRFLRIVRRTNLPTPETRVTLSGFEVDFYWPGLRLVVETDGGRFHRTPAQQTRDRRRDQAHAVAGLLPLRFTHAQVRWEPSHVEATLTAVARRLLG